MQSSPARALHSPQPWVRALSWVLTQPGLIRGLPGGVEPLFAANDPRLHRLLMRTQQDPIPLLQSLQGPRARLVGWAFERLIEYGLVQGLGYEVLARDLQIQGEGRTLGALDFVLRTPAGEAEHWELSFKLYLQDRPELSWDAWIGPGRRDRLDIKLRRMIDHQLPLSERSETAARLESVGVQGSLRRRALLQGVLFQRWDRPPQRTHHGERVCQGRWIHEDQLPRLRALQPGAGWIRREKPNWFGPMSDPDAAWCSLEEVRAQLAEQALDFPQLWSVRPAEPGEPETLCFIVPSRWGREQP